MSTRMQKFSSQADPKLLASLRKIAQQDGRHFQAVLEDAMRDYIEARRQDKPRASVMAHFQDSLEKNRELYKLLAE